MTAAKVVAPADVDALFAGRSRPPQSAPAAGEPSLKPGWRWSKCHGCNVTQPALFTFMGREDWSPEVAIDSPVRALVIRLRSSTGRRTILLCGGCIAECERDAQPDRAGEDRPRLFEA